MLFKLMSGDIINIDSEDLDEIPFLLKHILYTDYHIDVFLSQIKFFKVNEDDDHFSIFIENLTIDIIEDISIKVKDFTGVEYERFIINIISSEYSEYRASFVLYKRKIMPWERPSLKVFLLDIGDSLVKHASVRSSTYPGFFIVSKVQEKRFSTLSNIFKNINNPIHILRKELEKNNIEESLIIDKLEKFFQMNDI